MNVSTRSSCLFWAAMLLLSIQSGFCAYGAPLPVIEGFDSPGTWSTSQTENTRRWLQEARYHVATSANDIVAFGMRNGEEISNCRFWAEATFLEGDDDAACGLVFRLQDASNYYRFLVTLAGQCCLQVMDSGQLRMLTDWLTCDVNGLGTSNALCVTADGASLACSVNNVEILRVADDAHITGDVGFIARTYGTQIPVEIAFDNVAITEPSDVFELTSPEVSDGLHYQDETIAATFWFAREGAALAEAPLSEVARYFSDPPLVFKRINFTLSNLSASAVSIEWSDCSFVLPDGVVSSIAHEGIRFINLDQRAPATVIPPGGRVVDSVVPTKNVSHTSSLGWWIARLDLYEGTSLGLYLSLTIGDKTTGYDFRFVVSRLSEVANLSP